MVSLNITSGDKPSLRSTLTLVNSTLTEEVVLHLFHKSGPVNQVNAGKSIPLIIKRIAIFFDVAIAGG